MADFEPLTSVNQLLIRSKRLGGAPRLGAKRGGRWELISSIDFYRQARATAAALAAHGASAGQRVAILAESRPEWLVADFGCLAAGVIDVPIYPTLTGAQVAHILRDSAAVGVFVSNADQAAKVATVRGELPDLRWVCCFESPEWEAWTQSQHPDAEAEFDARLEATPGPQAATLLYTSGTTGVPKGLELTHANLCANLNVTTRDFVFGDDERRLSLLPLSHITERHMAYVDMLYAGATYFAESLEQVPANLQEVRPTVLVGVPRLYEKIVAGVRAEAARKPAWQQSALAWALRVGGEIGPYRLGGKPVPAGLRLRAALADRVAGRKLRARLGGRLDKIVSGGAPLNRDVAEFLLALGLIVDEGYGLSETSPVVAISRPGGRRLGSVGKPVANVEVRFAEDGELLVRGPSVFGGYHGLPEETAAVLREGWFHTGDIGHQDADGFIFLTDRKKDLIKTAGGKFIAPQPIEAQLKASGCVAEAVIVGDGRPYAAVLLTPDWAALERRGLACANRAAACQDAAVRAVFAAEVERVNAGLARFETLKRFALLAEPFTVEGGELTPSMKVRRRAVAERRREEIERLYAG